MKSKLPDFSLISSSVIVEKQEEYKLRCVCLLNICCPLSSGSTFLYQITFPPLSHNYSVSRTFPFYSLYAFTPLPSLSLLFFLVLTSGHPNPSAPFLGVKRLLKTRWCFVNTECVWRWLCCMGQLWGNGRASVHVLEEKGSFCLGKEIAQTFLSSASPSWLTP